MLSGLTIKLFLPGPDVASSSTCCFIRVYVLTWQIVVQWNGVSQVVLQCGYPTPFSQLLGRIYYSMMVKDNQHESRVSDLIILTDNMLRKHLVIGHVIAKIIQTTERMQILSPLLQSQIKHLQVVLLFLQGSFAFVAWETKLKHTTTSPFHAVPMK